MKLDLQQVVLALNGAPIKQSAESDKETLLKDFLVNALMTETPRTKAMNGVEKMVRYRLCEVVFEGDTIDINVGQMKDLVDTVGEVYPIAILGPIMNILEA